MFSLSVASILDPLFILLYVSPFQAYSKSRKTTVVQFCTKQNLSHVKISRVYDPLPYFTPST